MKHFNTLFLFVFALFVFSGCQDEEEPPKTYPSNQAEYYFTAQVDGKEIRVEDGVRGYSSAAGAFVNDDNGLYIQEQSVLLQNPSLKKSFGITLVKTFAQTPTDCTPLENMFRLGSYSFGHAPDSVNTVATDGAVVLYTDDNGIAWRSDSGTGNQAGSTFQIVEHFPNSDGFSKKISRVKFSCKLYDGKGNVKTLTNGEVRGRSVQCVY